MKTAIVCDWLITYAGSERVLQEIINCFPEADLFAVVDFIPPEKRGFLQHKPVTTTFIQKLPWARTRYRSYLPLMPLAIERLDLSAYDLILSSSHAVAKGVITTPKQTHISYVHTPMRYAWDLQDQYLRESNLNQGLRGWVARYLLQRLRNWDQHVAIRVDHFIANSNYIAKRIARAYRRPSKVIYPPVNTTLFAPHLPKEDFYLTISRMVPYKKLGLIVESFSNMPNKKLVVIGDGPDFVKIQKKAGPNIELLGHQPDDVLVAYMQRAKAFVFAAEEDFGIVLLEAQACATPVIAFGKGGALETVRGLDQEEPTGVFFQEQTVASLCQAVGTFERQAEQINPTHCIEQARRFSPEHFRQAFKQAVFEAQQ